MLEVPLFSDTGKLCETRSNNVSPNLIDEWRGLVTMILVGDLGLVDRCFKSQANI